MVQYTKLIKLLEILETRLTSTGVTMTKTSGNGIGHKIGIWKNIDAASDASRNFRNGMST